MIKGAGTLDEFIKKHLSKELGLSSECPGSPYGFLFGNLPEFEKGSDAAGYVGCGDSDSE